jgi:hypothetical protein
MMDTDREGYVFAEERANTVGFALYRHGAHGDYLSTAVDRVPAGYEWVANIGWIMRPEPGN